MRMLLRRAWPFALAALLAAAQMRLSLILLEHLLGAGQAGQFAAASRFVEAGRMLPQAFFVALFPALATFSQDRPALDRLFRRATIGLAAFAMMFGVALVVLGPWLVRLTYGPAFEPAAGILPLLGWLLLPGVLKGARTLYWYAQGCERFVNRITLWALLAQFLLSLAAIQWRGTVGVALALVVTEAGAATALWLKRPPPDAGAFRQDDQPLTHDAVG